MIGRVALLVTFKKAKPKPQSLSRSHIRDFYLIVLGLIFIGVGLLLYLIDFLVKKFQNSKRAFWSLQSVLTIALIYLFAFVTYMKWQEHNYIVFQRTLREKRA